MHASRHESIPVKQLLCTHSAYDGSRRHVARQDWPRHVCTSQHTATLMRPSQRWLCIGTKPFQVTTPLNTFSLTLCEWCSQLWGTLPGLNRSDTQTSRASLAMFDDGADCRLIPPHQLPHRITTHTTIGTKHTSAASTQRPSRTDM
jgi:hypothetical protein